MDHKFVQLMATLNQISVRGDDVDRMCKARMLLREIAANQQVADVKPDTAVSRSGNPERSQPHA